MPLYRDEAVVLRTHKLGEADRIITLLSRRHGKIRAVAKGIRRTSSRFGARLEPFMVVDVQLYEGRSLDTVTQAEALASYGAQIVADYPRYTAASVMVETADRLSDAETSLDQYLLLVGGLRALARDEHPAELARDSYLLRALSRAGWEPNLGSCSKCGVPGPHEMIAVQLGGVLCTRCAPAGSRRIDGATIALMTALLRGDWAVAESSDQRTRREASAIVSAYTNWHIERSLRSLSHVESEHHA